jgi:hypothetical protein
MEPTPEGRVGQVVLRPGAQLLHRLGRVRCGEVRLGDQDQRSVGDDRDMGEVGHRVVPRPALHRMWDERVGRRLVQHQDGAVGRLPAQPFRGDGARRARPVFHHHAPVRAEEALHAVGEQPRRDVGRPAWREAADEDDGTVGNRLRPRDGGQSEHWKGEQRPAVHGGVSLTIMIVSPGKRRTGCSTSLQPAALPASRFTARPTIAALNRKEASPCASTSRRIAGDAVVTSETCAVMPTVTAR